MKEFDWDREGDLVGTFSTEGKFLCYNKYIKFSP